MKKLFLIALCIGGIAMDLCAQQEDKSDLDSFIYKKGDSLSRKYKLPGLFIGVLNDTKRSYYSFGYADADKKMPFDSATIFEAGSITKTMTAYVLESVLREKGIDDRQSILPYLPDSVQQNKSLDSISFLSLLNHTSGLPRLPDNMDLTSSPMSPYDDYSKKDLFAYLLTCQPAADGKSNYSNLGAGLAAVLAERISGKSYDDLLKQYLFIPFRIAFHDDSSTDKIENKSQGYFEKDKAVYWKENALAGAYTLKCSAAELLAYLENISRPPTAFSDQIVNKLLEPTVAINAVLKICRAWHMFELKGKPFIYWHNGGTYGFSTFCAFLRDKSKAVVVVINSFNKNNISDGLGITIMNKLIE